MMKKIIVLVIFITIIMTGCGKAPTATLEPEGTETIITENIIEEKDN
jgi:PBP1b-binding outer membrane lipoprotein LpoB